MNKRQRMLIVEHDQFAYAFGGEDACLNSGVAILHLENCDTLDVALDWYL